MVWANAAQKIITINDKEEVSKGFEVLRYVDTNFAEAFSIIIWT